MANARHAVRDRHAGQRWAVRESIPANARHAVWDYNACQVITMTKSIITNTCHAVINYCASNFLVAPRRFIRIEGIVFHSAGTADRQHALAVQRPGQVAAVPLSAAGAAGHNVRRQRSGRQERRDHQHREHKAQKSFFHMFSSLLFTIFAHFAARVAFGAPPIQQKIIPILLIPFLKVK